MRILGGVGRTVLRQARATAKRVLVRAARRQMSRTVSRVTKRLFG